MLDLALPMKGRFIGVMPPLLFLQECLPLRDDEKGPSGEDVRNCFQNIPVDKPRSDIPQPLVSLINICNICNLTYIRLMRYNCGSKT